MIFTACLYVSRFSSVTFIHVFPFLVNRVMDGLGAMDCGYMRIEAMGGNGAVPLLYILWHNAAQWRQAKYKITTLSLRF